MNNLPQISDDSRSADPNRHVSPANGINKIINSYIILADQKASFIIAAGIAAPSFLLNNLPQGMGFATFVYFASAALFILSLILSVSALIPRLPKQGTGSVFWGDIASCDDVQTYQKRFDSSVEKGQLWGEYATLNYYSSRILRSKFRCLRFSIFSFVGGSILGIVSATITRL